MMNHETESYILQTMSKYLDNRQMIKLKDVLQESIRQSRENILEKSSQELLEMFIATKRLEGRSEKTLLLWVVTLLSSRSVRNINHPLCGCAVCVIQKNHLSAIMRLFKPNK